MKQYNERPYRPCVGICLVNDDGLIFAGKRIDNRAEAWQMPQGGIDEGEDAITACFREMAEEIGTNKAGFWRNIPIGLIMIFQSSWPINYGKAPIADKARNGCFCAIRAWMLILISQPKSLNLNNGSG